MFAAGWRRSATSPGQERTAPSPHFLHDKRANESSLVQPTHLPIVRLSAVSLSNVSSLSLNRVVGQVTYRGRKAQWALLQNLNKRPRRRSCRQAFFSAIVGDNLMTTLRLLNDMSCDTPPYVVYRQVRKGSANRSRKVGIYIARFRRTHVDLSAVIRNEDQT